MFFVIGSRNSSNSVRLVEGCKIRMRKCNTYSFWKVKYHLKKFIIEDNWYFLVRRSEVLVENFINELKNKFSINIEEIEIIKENVVFKVPKIKLNGCLYKKINQRKLVLINKILI